MTSFATQSNNERKSSEEEQLAIPYKPRQYPAGSIKLKRIGPFEIGATITAVEAGDLKHAKDLETGMNYSIVIRSRLGEQFLRRRLQPSAQVALHPADGNDIDLSDGLGSIDQAAGEKQLRRTERHIAILKLLQHRNLFTLQMIFESPSHVAYVFEPILEGTQELYQFVVRRQRLKEKDALLIFKQILAAVRFLHRHFIYHRNLKLESFLVDESTGLVRLTGYSFITHGANGKLLETPCGNAHCSAPEVGSGKPYDGAKADAWSCGVILYNLLNGSMPFDGDTVQDVLSAVRKGEYLIPSAVGEKAADLIKHILVLDVRERYSINQIIAHPWIGGSINDNDSLTSIVPSPDALKPLAENEIRLDIVACLGNLGYGTEMEIIGKLISAEPNFEKAFYHLLSHKRSLPFPYSSNFK